MPKPLPQPVRRKRGFERTSGLLQPRIRALTGERGFSVARLLTHWEEVAGQDIAKIARPVKVTYGRGGIGATLTLLTIGAHAPVLQAEIPRIRARVNACYGYAAISRLRITQTAPTGFSEGQVAFAHAPAPKPPAPSDAQKAAAKAQSAPVSNTELRRALETLGANILCQSKDKKGT